MSIKSWLSDTFGTKSYTTQILVSDDGFMVAPTFTGGDLYTVYTQALWTYICASRISQDVSSIPAVVQVRAKGGAWENSPDHPLNAVLERPYGRAPFAPNWNWRQSVAAGTLRQELGGNQFYGIESSGNRLLMLGLYLVELKANADHVSGYFDSYTPEGGTAVIPVDKVVNVMSANPCSWWSGVSPTIANEQATRVDYAASRRMRYDMETRIDAGLIFKVKGLFTIDAKQKANIKADLAANYEGAVNAGKSMVVGDNTTIENAPKATVNDIPAQAIVARDSIVSSFGVSPPTVGILRDAKYQTWDQALRAQYFLCVSPRINNLYGTINSQAIKPIYGENVRLWYDLVQSPLGLAALRERGETAKVFMDLGFPAKQLNDRFALEMQPFAGWDRPNMATVVAGHAEDLDDSDPAPDEPEDTDSEDDDTEGDEE